MSLAPATKVFELYSLDKVFYYTLTTKEITFVSQNMDVALVGKSAHIEVHSRGVELVEEDVEEEGEEEGGPAGGQHGAHLPRGEGVRVAVDVHHHHVSSHAHNTGHCQPGHRGNEL